jgi:ATP-binding cassette subfamily E protein 1
MATYLADRVIVYDGIPSVECRSHAPEPLVSGMNKFLKNMDITFRRDPTNHRPKINKGQSVKDREQKQAGTYFYVDDDDDEVVENEASQKPPRKPRRLKPESDDLAW